MKRYLMIGIIILSVITIYNILSLYTGIYINLDKSAVVENNVYTKDGQIYVDKKLLQIKGVEISGAYPGYNFSDYEIDKETYLKWLEQIQKMGANTVKASSRLNPQFYEALYEYNENKKEPLYLIQSIEIEEYESNNAESIYGFKSELMKEALLAIDAIHGNRYIVTSGISSRGLYTKDVSKWTIGYIISNIGKEETIAYTDNTDRRIADNGYSGKYFYTNPQEASETECIVAEIMDKMVQYETNKYKEQKLVSLMVDVLKDPFKYKQNVNIQLGKMAYIDMNNIKTKDELQTGQFVSYDMTGAIKQFTNILDDEEIARNQDILNSIQTDSVYGGYVDFINKYYDAPVLIASYGFSTSRMIEREYEKATTEQEQGEKLIDYYKKFVNLGSCGGIISSWQDNWAITTWNVKYSTKEEKEIYWFNRESIDQCNGILTFESENREKICYVDGDINEWADEESVAEQNGIKIYCRYDLENVYIMAKNINQNVIYIPIDTTQKSGATNYENIEFARGADFLIKIDGTENSEILVQEYYDSIRAMYEDNITRVMQYSNVPNKNTSNFVSMRAILRKQIDQSVDISLMTAEQRMQYRMYRISNIGKLRYGKNNPNSTEYNSLADFCFGENCVEIQIPWQLLNFSSPSEMQIHDDYYENYGVEETKIEEMYLGIGEDTTNKIEFGKVELKKWGRNVNVQERLKKSYDVIKKFWCEE